METRAATFGLASLAAACLVALLAVPQMGPLTKPQLGALGAFATSAPLLVMASAVLAGNPGLRGPGLTWDRPVVVAFVLLTSAGSVAAVAGFCVLLWSVAEWLGVAFGASCACAALVGVAMARVRLAAMRRGFLP